MFRLNSATGQIFTTGGAGGTQTTGDWVTNGTKFYVLNVEDSGSREGVVKGVTTVTVTNADCEDRGSGDFTNPKRKP